MSTHESFNRSDDVKVGSERSFGIVFTVVFTIIGLFPLTGGESPLYGALVLAVLFLLFALFFQTPLKPLNILWFKFGMLLSRVMTPVIMFLLFITTVVPMGLIMRAVGHDAMRRKWDKNTDSYWIKRDPAGPSGDTMTNQF